MLAAATRPGRPLPVSLLQGQTQVVFSSSRPLHLSGPAEVAASRRAPLSIWMLFSILEGIQEAASILRFPSAGLLGRRISNMIRATASMTAVPALVQVVLPSTQRIARQRQSFMKKRDASVPKSWIS